MSKRSITLIYVSIITLPLIVKIVPFKKVYDTVTHPAPTQVIKEEEGSEQENYEKWYESIHRAAPGVNWRAIDRQTRYTKYSSHRFLKHSFSSLDTLADGNIIGNWHERGSSNQAGRIWAADMDTATGYVYCLSDGGNVWRGTLTGQNWTVLNDKLKFLIS